MFPYFNGISQRDMPLAGLLPFLNRDMRLISDPAFGGQREAGADVRIH
jgi:hypothetical protein